MTTTITPSIGHGVIPTQAGVGTTPGYDAVDVRRIGLVNVSEGVVGHANAYKVTQRAAGANMSVDIAANLGDGAVVQGEAVTAQGRYLVSPHSGTINEVITTAHATLPRIDSIVLEIRDTTHDASGLNLARTVVYAGTPTSGASLDNRNGAGVSPAATPSPSSGILLADVLVPAASATVVDTNIRDYRPLASSSAEPGEIRMYAGAAAPLGWKFCIGSTFKRFVYARMFTNLGTGYGVGDGSTTFGTPDLRGRTPVGPDSGAGRLSNNNSLGSTAGAETHLLAPLEGSGNPNVATQVTGGGNTSTVDPGDSTPVVRNFVGQSKIPGDFEFLSFPGIHYSGFSDTSIGVAGSHAHTYPDHSHPLASTYANQAHNNMQPYVCCNYIIFTGSAA